MVVALVVLVATPDPSPPTEPSDLDDAPVGRLSAEARGRGTVSHSNLSNIFKNT